MNFVLLGCDTVLLVTWFLMFGGMIMPSSSKVSTYTGNYLFTEAV